MGMLEERIELSGETFRVLDVAFKRLLEEYPPQNELQIAERESLLRDWRPPFDTSRHGYNQRAMHERLVRCGIPQDRWHGVEALALER